MAGIARTWHIALGARLGAGQLACGVRDLPRGIQEGLGDRGKPQTPSCRLYSYDLVPGAGDVGGFWLLSRKREGLVPHYEGLIDHTYYQYGLMDSYFIQ